MFLFWTLFFIDSGGSFSKSLSGLKKMLNSQVWILCDSSVTQRNFCDFAGKNAVSNYKNNIYVTSLRKYHHTQSILVNYDQFHMILVF